VQPKRILQQVKDTYSAISHEFDATRDRVWPEFSIFLKTLHLKKSSKPIRLLDVGCGNGRLAHFLKNYPIDYTGVDNSREMIRISKKKNRHALFRVADARKLPFPKDAFQSVWMIAVLHHLPTEKLRKQALKEIKRVLKKNATLMLTVWNLLPQTKYRTYIDPKTHDALIPWGKEKKWKRYYHAFTMKELTELIQGAGFSLVKKIRNSRNLAVIAQKS